jgi:hypothetical protein
MSQNSVLNLSPEDLRVLEALRSRLMPLVYSIEQLQAEVGRYQEAPPPW